MYLNPDWMTTDQRNAVAAWLERNGCRHDIALEPLVIRGQWVHYTALCRRDRKSRQRMVIRDNAIVPLGRRRVRVTSRNWHVREAVLSDDVWDQCLLSSDAARWIPGVAMSDDTLVAGS